MDAMTDELTGLWNKSYFDQRLAAELALVNRGGRCLSVLMVDLDNFTAVNEMEGHDTGDAVLKCAAKTLSRCCRGEDVVARYEGTKFAILLLGATDYIGASAAQRLCDTLANSWPSINGRTIHITASIGVADSKSWPGTIVAEADRALMQAKRSGRNRTAVAKLDTQAA
jgi:two-component system cell cycle response regulator